MLSHCASIDRLHVGDVMRSCLATSNARSLQKGRKEWSQHVERAGFRQWQDGCCSGFPEFNDDDGDSRSDPLLNKASIFEAARRAVSVRVASCSYLGGDRTISLSANTSIRVSEYGGKTD